MDYAVSFGSYALIIGASTTIGEQFARQVAKKGMNVILVARRQTELERVASEIRAAHGVSTRVVALDLMPSQPGILGFHNRWYPLAIETAAQITLPNGIDIRLITAPVFVATKFEAFHGRGNNDYLASHDLEDIITVVDGRQELAQEIDQADGELRRYIAAEINTLLEDHNFLMALPGHLPGDAASQARLPELIRRMRAIGNTDK